MPAEDERYWHTTTAGTGRETGTGYRPGVSSHPRPSSPMGSAFHPERPRTERFNDGSTRRNTHPHAKPVVPETGANLGDRNVYVHERVGTALWSSVLESIPVVHDHAPPQNSNYMSANLGDMKTYVHERQSTLLHSTSLDAMAKGLETPPPEKTPSKLSVSSSRASSKATSQALLDKVESLQAELAREEKRRKEVESKIVGLKKP